jgi:capsular exopolysaccharide synthesis family protein
MVDNRNLPSVGGALVERDSEESIDLRRYIYVILKYKWMILSFVVLAGLLTTLLAYSLQPLYRSTATLLIGGNEPLLGSEETGNTRQVEREQFFNTQYELLKSREVAEAATVRLNLNETSWFDLAKENNHFNFNWLERLWAYFIEPKNNNTVPVDEPDSNRKQLVWMMNGLEIKPVDNTSMVMVSFESYDPEMAALVANAVAKAYIETNLEHRIETTKVAAEWLKEQLRKAQSSLDEAVDELQQYRERVGLVDLNGKQNVYEHQLETLIDQLAIAQRNRAEAYHIYHRAARLRETGQLDALPLVFNNAWIQQVKRERQEVERQLKLDKDRYLGTYPRRKREEAEKTLESLNANIEDAFTQIVEGLRTDYEVASDLEKQLQARRTEFESKLQEITRQRFKVDVLQQVVETNRQSYNTYMNQFMRTRTKHADTITMIARLVDPAVPEALPIWPKKTIMIGMALVLATFMGTGLAFIWEGSIFHNKLKTREDVENKLSLPLLGELTLLPKKQNGIARAPGMEFLNEPKSVFAESIRTIRAGIILSRPNQSTPMVLVTSTVSGEGKSIVALNVALALSQVGNVLLVDADLRRPSLASLCSMEPKSLGLVDLVEGTRKVAECITQIAGDIHLLPAGSALPLDTMRIFASTRFSALLSELSQVYDSIVIDSSPVDIVSDVKMLAGQVSGVIYVVKADSTPYQAVKQGLASLNKTGATLIGAVLNQVNPRKVSAYGKYKYGYYRSFDHYGQSIQES